MWATGGVTGSFASSCFALFSRCGPKPGVIRSLSCSFKCARPHRHHPRSAAFAGKSALSETQSAPGLPRSSLPLVTGQGPGYRDLARKQIARCKRACLMREPFAQGRVGWRAQPALPAPARLEIDRPHRQIAPRSRNQHRSKIGDCAASAWLRTLAARRFRKGPACERFASACCRQDAKPISKIPSLQACT